MNSTASFYYSSVIYIDRVLALFKKGVFFMKKVLSKHFLSLVVAMALTCTLVQPMAAFAEEVSVEDKISTAEAAVNQLAESSQNENAVGVSEVQPRSHVSYYPSSGPNSGSFIGAVSYYPATYSYLPAYQTVYFSYCVSGGGTCYLRFYRGNSIGGSAIYSAALTADDYAHESYINLPSSGPYTIEVYVPSGNASTERIYAFNLYSK